MAPPASSTSGLLSLLTPCFTPALSSGDPQNHPG
jgi:hypothetical protein